MVVEKKCLIKKSVKRKEALDKARCKKKEKKKKKIGKKPSYIIKLSLLESKSVKQ